jgi:hypothetical protein
MARFLGSEALGNLQWGRNVGANCSPIRDRDGRDSAHMQFQPASSTRTPAWQCQANSQCCGDAP